MSPNINPEKSEEAVIFIINIFQGVPIFVTGKSLAIFEYSKGAEIKPMI